jgi:hypothetical protein
LQQTLELVFSPISSAERSWGGQRRKHDLEELGQLGGLGGKA